MDILLAVTLQYSFSYYFVSFISIKLHSDVTALAKY
jgi:hypothetical protein